MNEFFCSVAKKLAAGIDVTQNPLLSGEFSIKDGGKTILGHLMKKTYKKQ